ncbi:hypothetical protein HDU91_001122, partial [Kappamyces sp. JEL0680]
MQQRLPLLAPSEKVAALSAQLWLASLPFGVLALAWLLLAVASPTYNAKLVAPRGGHYALFLNFMLVVSAQTLTAFPFFLRSWPAIEWNRAQVIALLQEGLGLLLILLVGSWSHRHEADDEEGVSREKGASVFSRFTFAWLSPLIKKGNAEPLKQEDLWTLVDDDKAELVLESYRSRRQPTHSLGWRIFLQIYPYVLFQFACSVLGSFLQFAGPYFLFQIVATLQIPDVDRIAILPALFGLFACSLVTAIVNGQMYFTGRRCGTMARTILIDELYVKSLHRVQGASGTTDDSEDQQATLGKIVTLMSVDTERIREFLSYIQDPFIHMPIVVVVSLTSLFFVLGWASLAGVACIILLGPVSTLLGNMIVKYQEEQLKNTDARVGIMNELLQGIRIVKYFAWENYFTKKILEARERELASIVKLFGAYVGFGVLGNGSGIIIAFFTFWVYVVFAGKRLDAATAFTAINLLNVVRQTIAWLPQIVMSAFKAKVSLDRIAKYLNEREIDKYSLQKSGDEVHSDSGTADDSAFTIGFRNAEFQFYGTEEETADAAASHFKLRNLNVEFPVGKLSLICGPTGSGKTSMLLALLGEMECVQGEHFVPKSDTAMVNPFTGFTNTVAYASQTAWLLNATVRDNILFGEPFDAARYEEVIRGCALAKDFETFEGGDLTEI